MTCTQVHALEIGAMRFGVHGSAVRIVMDMDALSDFRAQAQDTPPRAVVTLPALKALPSIRRSTLPPLLDDIRMEPDANARTRLVFVLKNPALIRSAFMMPPEGAKAARLVLDLAPADAATVAAQKDRSFGTLAADTATLPLQPAGGQKPDEVSEKLPFAGLGGTNLTPLGAPAKPLAPTVPAPKTAAPKTPATLPLVVIDAGHGGIDPGAVSGSFREKDITLATARALKSALLATGRYRVTLTREDDRFIRLPERVNIARRAGADLFVSIHADSAPEAGSRAQGASFYTLSDRASDIMTERLAARENEVDALAGTALSNKDHDVATILVDLAMRETTGLSDRFARSLTGSFNHAGLPMLEPAHKYAGFVVLKAPDVPSVLIELGFLSNPNEVKKLADDHYRTRIAQSISGGIDAWFAAKGAKTND